MAIDPAVHRTLAVEANDATWEILGRPLDEISDDDAEEMTRRAGCGPRDRTGNWRSAMPGAAWPCASQPD